MSYIYFHYTQTNLNHKELTILPLKMWSYLYHSFHQSKQLAFYPETQIYLLMHKHQNYAILILLLSFIFCLFRNICKFLTFILYMCEKFFIITTAHFLFSVKLSCIIISRIIFILIEIMFHTFFK